MTKNKSSQGLAHADERHRLRSFSLQADSSNAQLFYFENERRHTHTHTHTGEIRFSASSLVNRPKINHRGNCIKVYARDRERGKVLSLFSASVHPVLSSLILFFLICLSSSSSSPCFASTRGSRRTGAHSCNLYLSEK